VLSPALHPEIVNVVQIDLRQKRRDHGALGCAPLDCQQAPFFEHACLQPLADQAQHAPVPDPVLQEPHQPRVAHAVEERLDIGIQDPVDPPSVDPDHERVQRGLAAHLVDRDIAKFRRGRAGRAGQPSPTSPNSPGTPAELAALSVRAHEPATPTGASSVVSGSARDGQAEGVAAQRLPFSPES
jgi:hypothetical protein